MIAYKDGDLVLVSFPGKEPIQVRIAHVCTCGCKLIFLNDMENNPLQATYVDEIKPLIVFETEDVNENI